MSAEWKHSRTVQRLSEWALRFITVFNLHIPTPAISIDRLPRTRLGHFRSTRSGSKLIDLITIDEEHVEISPEWMILGTLLHQILHQWQLCEHDRVPQDRWTRNYHDRQFRRKAKELGLDIDARGYTAYFGGETPFRALLRTHSVDVCAHGPAPKTDRRGRTNLALWTCQCAPPIRLRVGRAKVRVRCEDCGTQFKIGG